MTKAEEYLMSCYPYWSKDFLIYEKGINTKARLSQIRQEYEKHREKEQQTQENVKKTKPPEGFYFLE